MTSRVALSKSADPGLAHVGGFAALHDELDYTVPVSRITGALPAELRGTFFRIGPGRNELGGKAFGHWFDGDGMLHRITFRDDGVHYLNRYVRTPKFLAETAAGKVVCRSFGHNVPGGVLKNAGRLPANAANTSLIWHGGHLLALWEGGRPWELDPATLETLGEFDYDGRLGKTNAFSAHGTVDPRTGCYYNFGIGVGLRGPGIDFYRIDPRGCLDRKVHIPLGFAPFCHDFALTEHYAVFFINPLYVKHPLKFIAGLCSFNDALVYEPAHGMQALVVSLDTLEVVRRFELAPFVSVHFGNSWEDGRQLVINVTRFEDWSVNAALTTIFHARNEAKGTLWQYRLDLASGSVEGIALPGQDSIEFPQWDHRRTGVQTRYTYAATVLPNATPGFFNGVQRLDHHTGEVRVRDFGPDRFTSEAMFAPRHPDSAEDDGFLVAAVYDAARHGTDIVVLDARTLEDVAVVPLRHHMPFGFHCGYTARAFV
ncbi:MAG: carotenoid oxygenase family protein, partial [Moraxellaceae bacterium]|nr:carotenoid oxygenase family protein [Moraxellaceae bacterium]